MNPAIIKDVRVDDEHITFILTDGREGAAFMADVPADPKLACRVGGSV